MKRKKIDKWKFFVDVWFVIFQGLFYVWLFIFSVFCLVSGINNIFVMTYDDKIEPDEDLDSVVVNIGESYLDDLNFDLIKDICFENIHKGSHLSHLEKDDLNFKTYSISGLADSFLCAFSDKDSNLVGVYDMPRDKFNLIYRDLVGGDTSR